LIEADGTNTTVYTVGDDVLAQAKGGVTQWLLYDGQGVKGEVKKLRITKRETWIPRTQE